MECQQSYPPQDLSDSGYSEPITFIDDKNIFVPLKDVFWLFKTVTVIGAKYGLYPKRTKNKTLTNIVGVSIV
eukprot:2471465-Ditylum_brightwellii.AAC.1